MVRLLTTELQDRLRGLGVGDDVPVTANISQQAEFASVARCRNDPTRGDTAERPSSERFGRRKPRAGNVAGLGDCVGHVLEPGRAPMSERLLMTVSMRSSFPSSRRCLTRLIFGRGRGCGVPCAR